MTFRRRESIGRGDTWLLTARKCDLARRIEAEGVQSMEEGPSLEPQVEVDDQQQATVTVEMQEEVEEAAAAAVMPAAKRRCEAKQAGSLGRASSPSHCRSRLLMSALYRCVLLRRYPREQMTRQLCSNQIRTSAGLQAATTAAQRRVRNGGRCVTVISVHSALSGLRSALLSTI